MRQAIILAGGKGTRLRSVIGDLPKPLVDVCGAPLLSHQLRLLREHSFSEVILLVSHRADRIREWLEREPSTGMVVRVIDDGVPRGTAGAALAVLSELAPEFLVMYGDTMVNVDLTRFFAWHHAAPDAAASLFLHPNDHPHDSDLVEIDGDGRILKFHPYPHPPDAWLPNLVNAALYIVRHRALKPWSSSTPPLDFARDLFPRMLDAGALLRGYNSPEFIKDAGTPSRLEQVRAAYAEGIVWRASLDQPQRAVFVDRDGTLNKDTGHIAGAEDFHVFDFVGPALRRLNDAKWRAVVLTNQPVIARGEASEADLRRIHARLDTEVARYGAYFDRLYYCPHHPDRGFPSEVEALKIACSCRKPEAGMIKQAQRELNIDLAESWLIGDSSADLGAAENAGVSSILVETGQGGLDGRYPFEAGFTVPDFAAAVDFVLRTYPALAEIAAPLLRSIEPGEDLFIGGLARSGKSTLAATLQRELRRQGATCEVIHLDRWILDEQQRRAGVFNRFDMSSIQNFVTQARTRQTGEIVLDLPFYQRRLRQNPPTRLRKRFAPNMIVVWEGVVAVEIARRMDLANRSIEVRTDETARRERFKHYYHRRDVASADADVLYRSRQLDETVDINRAGESAAFRICVDVAMRQASTGVRIAHDN